MSSGIFNINIKKNKLFEKLCYFTQPELKNYLVQKLGMEKGDGWCYRQGTFPVLLTAHMDTVHKVQCKKVKYWINKNEQTVVTSDVGIGGDDRCGIYMILKILEKVDCFVLFCEDEEIGSVGARKFIKTDLCKNLKGKFKYIIELDRAHDRDAVFYDDDNKEFHKFITKEFWKEDYGSFSDICVLSPEMGISSVNLSCGYYGAHTTSESVILDELERSIEETIKLLDRTDVNAEPYEYEEMRYSYSAYDNWYSLYDGVPKKKLFDEKILEVLLSDGTYLNTAGDSCEECWMNFFMENRTVCFMDICDYYFY